MVVTRNKIFTLDNDNAVLEYKDFVCSGRGSEMATGIVDYLYNNTTLLAADIIEKTCNIVFKYHHSCGGKINKINVSSELKKNKFNV
jgi:ATP-dependent protease HslVU (ClpYQ) peptidase subunit